jgi:hypothetical protein
LRLGDFILPPQAVGVLRESFVIGEDMSEDWKCEFEYPDKKVRPFVWRKSDGRCWYCGCKLDPWSFHIDHFMPRSKGGGNYLDNLVPSCPQCNWKKKDREVYQWKIDVEREYGLSMSNGQIMSLRGEGMMDSVLEKIYLWEIPVIFWFERVGGAFAPFEYPHIEIRYKAWQP